MSDALWLHLISDAILAMVFFFIAFLIAYYLKRRTDLAFKFAFVMFAMFIMMGGLVHALNIVTLLVPIPPIHWIGGVIKTIIAFSSLVAAIVLWPLIPKALALPSSSARLARSEEIQTELRRDILTAQGAERALFEEKERLRVTLSCIGDAVITMDTFGKVSYLNPVAEIMTGWTSAEANGLPLPDVFS